MISPSSYLRQAIFALLDGNVTYNSAVVPVYENEGVEDTAVQIIIGDYSDSPAGNTRTFGSQSRQVIQIVSEQPTAARKTVDLIGDQVLTLISPTPQGDALGNADFNVNIKGHSVNYLTEDSSAGTKIVRLIISFDLLIINK